MTEKEIKERDRTVTRYERKVLSTFLQKEERADITHIHKYTRDFWVRTCDSLSSRFKKFRTSLGHTTTGTGKKRSLKHY